MHITFESIPTNGVKLHTALAGPVSGDPVLLLHGFPDVWFAWEAQMEYLVDAGYRVIVPDQRGYNLSDKPTGIKNYQMATLVRDILELADTLGYDQFHLAGHDFGAMVAWHLAMRYPARLKRMVIINVPHPAVMRRYLSTHVAQMLKSWYVFFFQLPRLPEQLLKAKNWQFLINALPDDLPAEKRNRYRAAWSHPQAITSMINWYRAMLQMPGKTISFPRIQTPTLMLWGRQDPYLSYEMARRSIDRCEDGKLVTFEDASHWVMHDKPDAVNRYLANHFGTNTV